MTTALAAPAEGVERAVEPYGELDAITRRIKTGQVQLAEVQRYCDILIALGLAEAVEGFFRGVNVGSPQWDLFREMTRTKLHGTPNGVVSWSSRQRRYQANLQVLLGRWPEYEGILAACAAGAGRYQLHLARDGNYQVRDMANPNPLEGWLGGLRDQKGIVSLWKYQQKEGDFPAPVAFDGAGFGWLLVRVLETTQNTFLNYSPAVYAVEPDPVGIWMLLHMQDLREWLAHPRMHLFLGPEAKERYRAFLARGTHTLPNLCFFNPLTARGACDLVAIAEAEHKRRGERIKELQAEIAQLYAGRTGEWWQRRFEEAIDGRGAPLKVVGVTSRFTTVLKYSMEEVAQAVQAAGHAFHLSMEADDGTVQRTDLQMIREVQPDLLIQISRMRWENAVIPTCIPFLCWDQDYLSGMRSPETPASLDHLTYVAGHAAAHGYHAGRATGGSKGAGGGWPGRNCIFCHPAAATHRYAAERVSEELLRRYACDFSYVSNAADSPEDFAGQLRTTWGSHVPAGLWAELTERVIHGDGVNGDAGHWERVIQEAAERRGFRAPGVLTELAMTLVKIADRRFRHEALSWVAEYCRETGATLRLYGSGWERNAAFAGYACGAIEPGLAMRALYQATKINLQLILSGFLHSRALDGLAAGGFFLTRYSPADHDPDPKAPDFYRMARRAVDLGMWNYAQVWSTHEPEIASRRLNMGMGEPGTQTLEDFDYFYVSAELPAAGIAFETIPEITFGNAAELQRLAGKFLQDSEARETVRQRMHETVLRRFSYDARVKTFLHRMMRGFAYPA